MRKGCWVLFDEKIHIDFIAMWAHSLSVVFDILIRSGNQLIRDKVEGHAVRRDVPLHL